MKASDLVIIFRGKYQDEVSLYGRKQAIMEKYFEERNKLAADLLEEFLMLNNPNVLFDEELEITARDIEGRIQFTMRGIEKNWSSTRVARSDLVFIDRESLHHLTTADIGSEPCWRVYDKGQEVEANARYWFIDALDMLYKE